MPVRPGQLVDHRLTPKAAILWPGQHPQRVVAQHLEPRPGLRQALAQQRVAGGTVGASDAQHLIELVVKLHLLAKGRHPPLETEQSHGDLPAIARCAHQVVGGGQRLVEEHLVEFAGTGQLLDRLHADLRLRHRHQQKRQPLMTHAARLGTRQDETPVGFVGQRGPHLLPADHPVLTAVIETRAGLYVGQVRACAGLGITLAPELATAENARQQALALLHAAKGGEGRADQPFADMAHAPRTARPGIFFVENHLLADAQAAPAILRLPPHANPAASGQFSLPGFALFRETVLVARPATKAQRRELALQVRRQPVGNLPAEGLIRAAESDFHACSPNSCAARRSRCHAGVPSNCSLALARLK
ncbi:hypothetical protein D3C76_651080 [compost metagenome]